MILQQAQDKNRLVLIDGNAILHRAYFALPPLTTSSGELLNAVYGFTAMLLRVIQDLNPKYLAVAFDTAEPTFRHMEYVGYQAQRPKMATELAGQIGRVREVLRALGIPIYEVPGFEADDVIGTLAKQACLTEKRGKKKTRKDTEKIEVVIVSGDQDMLQLVSKNIKVYAPIRGLSETQIFDQKAVKEKMGIVPNQIVDYKGLVGDPSDNYPGVPGVGPKTASELLKKYKSVDNIYKHLDQLPETLARKLTEGRELAELSQKLAKIVADVPIKLNLKKCQFLLTQEEKERAVKKFKELGFKSLVKRLGEEKEGEKDKKDKIKNEQLKIV